MVMLQLWQDVHPNPPLSTVVSSSSLQMVTGNWQLNSCVKVKSSPACNRHQGMLAIESGEVILLKSNIALPRMPAKSLVPYIAVLVFI